MLRGAALDQVMSVASFFVSRVDSKIDAALKFRLVESKIEERGLEPRHSGK
jgi:transaldolase